MAAKKKRVPKATPARTDVNLRLKVNAEMREFRQLADERAKALDQAVAALARQGVDAVPKVLSTYGQYLTPAERELLESATAEVITRLVQTRAMLRSFRAPMDCI